MNGEFMVIFMGFYGDVVVIHGDLRDEHLGDFTIVNGVS